MHFCAFLVKFRDVLSLFFFTRLWRLLFCWLCLLPVVTLLHWLCLFPVVTLLHWHWLIFMHAWVWFLTHCWHLQLHVCFLTDGLTLFLSGGHAFPFTRSSRTKHTPGKLYSYLKCMYIFYPFAVVHFWLHNKGFTFLLCCSCFLCNLWFFVLYFCWFC